MKTMPCVIADNGGGLLLMTDHYCHHYDNPKQLARDIIGCQASDVGNGWDGNEPELRREPHFTDVVLHWPFERPKCHAGHAAETLLDLIGVAPREG